MVGLIWDIIKTLGGWAGKIFSLVKAPLKIEIEKLCYYLTENDPFSCVVVIDIHPSKYWLELLLTNTSGAEVFLKSIILKINKKEYKPTEDIVGINLEPGQLIKKIFIFSVPQSEAVREGEYELNVIPATGKNTSIKGNFPIQK